LHRSTASFIVVAAALLPILFGDVVELKNGQRLEGTFEKATSEGVVIEVGGQSITMALEKVRAIYFGSAPTSQAQVSQESAARDALQALKALKSATDAGVSYRDYAPRVLDTKIKVDQFVQSPQETDTPSREAIRVAMRFYELAAQAWNAKITPYSASGSYNPLAVGLLLEQDGEINACLEVKALIQERDQYFSKQRARGTQAQIAQVRTSFLGSIAGQSPGRLFSCASEKIAEAERLIGK